MRNKEVPVIEQTDTIEHDILQTEQLDTSNNYQEHYVTIMKPLQMRLIHVTRGNRLSAYQLHMVSSAPYLYIEEDQTNENITELFNGRIQRNLKRLEDIPLKLLSGIEHLVQTTKSFCNWPNHVQAQKTMFIL